MIILNFSEDIFKVEDFSFFVERVEDLDTNVLGIVDNTLETLFPNVTQKEWVNKEFCVVAPCNTEDNGELLLMFIKCIERLSKVSGYVKIFYAYLHKHPVAFYFRKD
jgi:hypothetical protein